LPLLRLVIPFIAGIIAGQCDIPVLPSAIIHSLVCAACLSLFLLHRYSRAYRLRWLTGSIIILAFVLAGYSCGLNSAKCRDRPVPDFDCDVTLLARVSDCPELKQNIARTICEIIAVRDSGRWNQLNTKAYLRVYGPDPGADLLYGSYYLLRCRPENLVFFSSGHSFNFRKYLFGRGVRYELGCRGNACRKVESASGPGFSVYAFSLRDRLLGILRDKGLDGREFAVAAALLLGYVGEIDTSLKSAFAASGTMHILSVSGMHVGIIFLFLEVALGILGRRRYGIYLKAAAEIAFIWAYAAVTGFSPAVLRAATCLSFLITGKTMKRKPEILNIICTSVLFLLLMDPLLLSDVGFQLSYLAVTGIVILYKPIYDLYITHRWFPDKVWALLAVSLAAQIATCPLSLYYFHRFPNYFMLSNLFVVPLSNGIILFGILALALSAIPFAGSLAIYVLKLLLALLNKSVMFTASLPGAVSDGFFPTPAEVAIMYILIAMVFLFFRTRQARFAMLALACLLVLQLSALSYKIGSSTALAIHQGRGGYVIRYSRRSKEICFYSGLRMSKDPFIAGQVGNERAAGRIGTFVERWIKFRGWQGRCGFPETGRFGNMLVAGKRKIYVLDHPPGKNIRVKTHADILLVTVSGSFRMDQLLKVLSPGMVLNASNAPRYRLAGWSDQCRRAGVKFYDLKKTGFYLEEN